MCLVGKGNAPPQTITLPPPKAVTGCTQLSECCSPLRRQTRLRPSIGTLRFIGRQRQENTL